jgi:hypothetical protein
MQPRRAFRLTTEFFSSRRPLSLATGVGLMVGYAFVSAVMTATYIGLIIGFDQLHLSLWGTTINATAPGVIPSVGFAIGDEVFRSGPITGVVLGELGWTLVKWLVFGLAIFVLTYPFATSGSLRETVVAVAWGAVPLAMSNAVTVAAVSLNYAAGGPELRGAMDTTVGVGFVTASDLSPILVVADVVSVLGLIAAVFVWSAALVAVRDVEWWQAAILAGLPAVEAFRNAVSSGMVV